MRGDAELKARIEAIYAFGAATEKLERPVTFEGHELGSMELCIFYDGHASTHPDFQNPYRLTKGVRYDGY